MFRKGTRKGKEYYKMMQIHRRSLIIIGIVFLFEYPYAQQWFNGMLWLVFFMVNLVGRPFAPQGATGPGYVSKDAFVESWGQVMQLLTIFSTIHFMRIDQD